MTLLSIAKQVALNVGLPQPDQVVGAPGREWAELLQLANETGEELLRRAEWASLKRTVPTSGHLPLDFDRLIDGVSVHVNGAIVRPLSRAEWENLPDQSGTPRYYLLGSETIEFWPAGSATITYQSRYWSTTGARLTSDEAEPLFEEDLFAKGLIVRWRRQKGMPYADEEAEFEAAFAEAPRRGRGLALAPAPEAGTNYVAIFQDAMQ